MKSNRKKEVRRRLGLMLGGIIIILILIGIMFWRHFQIDTTEGLSKLNEMNEIDVQTVDAGIQELEKEEKQADEEWQNRSFDEKFEGCMVIGDSITQGLYEYNVLEEEFVSAAKGVGTHDPDGEELAGLINKVVSAKPQKIFVAFGMNDIGYGSAEEFKSNYVTVIEKLEKALPDAQIYINSILPANENAVSRQSAYADVPEYNQKLEEICDEMGLTYIDNTGLVKEEYYASDGIHVSSDYYPVWADHMAEAAEL